MTLPTLTLFYAGAFGALFVALSIWVLLGRAQHKVHHGDGGNDRLQRRIRAHANFAEYVPFALLLIGFNEAAGVQGWIIRSLLIVLLVSRLMHPLGMIAPEASLQQYALRAPSILATWAVMLIASVLLLVR